MSRYLYRVRVSKARGKPIPEHDLEKTNCALNGVAGISIAQNSVLAELDIMKQEGAYEIEEMFCVEPPFETSDEQVVVVSWDFAKGFSLPNKARESMQEYFATLLGCDVS